MKQPTESLVTSVEVGRMLKKSARTVHRMAMSGDLEPAQKLPGPNGAYLFRRADVEALLAAPAQDGAA